MCGRFLSLSSPEELAERFAVADVRTDPLPPRFNVAPSMDVYAIVDVRGRRRLGTLRWGYLPSWADRRKRTRPQINARIETLARSRMFGDAFRRHRCILPVDGFYEWQDRGEGRRRQPFHLADPDGSPFAVAAIWGVWRDPADAQPVFGTAIVTTEAQGAMQEIHPRMPAILPPSLWDDWLTTDAGDTPHLLDAVAHAGVPRLTATAITGRVNAVDNEGPELIEPGRIEE